MKICVSSCLAGRPCRWKGDARPVDLDTLPKGARIVEFCPECAAGFGVPRPPIELVEAGSGDAPPRVLRVDRQADVTDALRAACDVRIAAFREEGAPDAFLLKSRSPSCGLSAPLHREDGSETGRFAPGVWAAAAAAAFPDARFVDETRIAELFPSDVPEPAPHRADPASASPAAAFAAAPRPRRASPWRHVAHRLVQMIPTLFGVTLLTFVLFNVIGGSPAAQVLGKNATAEQLAEYDHAHGWDRPLVVQYAAWLRDLARGDLGESLQWRQPVWEVLRQGVGVSLCLTVPILVLGTSLALLIGLVTAAAAGRWLDRAALAFTTALMSVNYVIWVSAGQYLLAFRWRLFPIWGFENWTYLLLPALIGIVSGLGGDVRFYRTVVLDEIRKPYVRTAVAKGLSPTRVLFVHVLRGSLVPVVTNASLSVPFLFTGSILLESFFGLPGLGGIGLDAVYAADYATVRAVVLISALLYQLSNLAADLLNAWLDPRIRLAGGAGQ